MGIAGAVVATALLSSACGVQVTGGLHPRDPIAASVDLAGRVVGTRASGAYGGGDLVLGRPSGGNFGARHVLAAGGYRWLGSPLSLELGAELGAGEPALTAWNGTGLYVGGASTVLCRVFGNQDNAVGYSVASLLIDVALLVRGGVWSRPAGDARDELGDASLQLGVRISGISDIPVSSNENWKP
jgi:hypothetical protein